jgi:hypothetical protein
LNTDVHEGRVSAMTVQTHSEVLLTDRPEDHRSWLGSTWPAAWDVHHHRTGRVVSRSLAEFCVVLDTLVAVVVAVVALNA